MQMKYQAPQAVHYAWADDAGDANLYNQEGFPAVPFRTDQWKGITDDRKFMISQRHNNMSDMTTMFFSLIMPALLIFMN